MSSTGANVNLSKGFHWKVSRLESFQAQKFAPIGGLLGERF